MARSALRYNRVNQSSSCLICIFTQCITENGYTTFQARREWKTRAWWEALFQTVMSFKCFWCQKITFYGRYMWHSHVNHSSHLVLEGKLKPKHLDGEAAVCWRRLATVGDATPTILSSTSPLTVDANRNVTAFRDCGVTTGQPPVSDCALFWYPVMRPF